ncbi:MAG: PIN domain-containing protein [Actinobacteria bacterium]|nr:PIN domain-containing protein [Actinomycetota bacterium]
MSSTVWDASAAVKLVVDEPGSPTALGHFRAPSRHLILDWTSIEVANVLWKRVMRSGADPVAAAEAFHAWESLSFETADAGDLASAALRLALEYSHPTYDCLYVALALSEDAALVTADARQREVAEAAGIEVLWIESSG